MDHLLGRSEVFASQKGVVGIESVQKLSVQQMASLMQLSRLPAFNDVIKKVASSAEFGAWVVIDNPELNVPVVWADDSKLSKFCKILDSEILGVPSGTHQYSNITSLN